MPNIGPMELGLVAIVVLLVFGPKKLPELGRSVGKGIREFRGTVSDVRGDGLTKEASPPAQSDAESS